MDVKAICEMNAMSRRIDMLLTIVLMSKISEMGLKPELCPYCSPACKSWKIQLFSKVFDVEITSSKIISIRTNSLFSSSQDRNWICIEEGEYEYYKTRQELLYKE